LLTKFEGEIQHDSQEFLSFVLDKLHEDLNRIEKKPYIEDKDYKPGESEAEYFRQCFENYKARNDSIISDIFYGMFRTKTKCPECNFVCLKYEPYNMLTVPVRGVGGVKEFAVHFIAKYHLFDLKRYETIAGESDTLESFKHKVAEVAGTEIDLIHFYEYNKKDYTYKLFSEESMKISTYLEKHKKQNVFLFVIEDVIKKFSGTDSVTVLFDIDKINRAEVIGIRKLVRAPKSASLAALYRFFHECLKIILPNYVDQFKVYYSEDSPSRLFDLYINGEKLDFDLSAAKANNIVELSEGENIVVSFTNPLLLQNQVFRDLNIKPERLPGKVATIYDCLDAFTQHECLDEDNQWHCPKCKQPRQANVQLKIQTLPRILIVHLKRFKHTTSGWSKFTEHIEFPMEDFDLSNYTTSPETNTAKYSLFATITHFGGMTKGHYIAFAKANHGKVWVEFDDDEVKNIKSAKEFLNEKPYILFYRRESN